MKIEELEEKFEEAAEIMYNWKNSSDDYQTIHEAVYQALRETQKAIIEYIKSKE